MIYHNISTLEDVKDFISQIASELSTFHPLADFTSYVYPDSYFRRYTDEEAQTRNNLLDRCCEVCSKHAIDFFSYVMTEFKLATADSERRRAKHSTRQPSIIPTTQGQLFTGI